MSTAPADPAEQARRTWQAWLDAVAHAAADVHHHAAHPTGPGAGTHAAQAAHVPPMPTAAVPAALETRRREVLERLAAATAAAERRRDELAAELARLAPVATRPPRSYGDGATLDIVG
jgi:hypothetical protein